MENMILLPYISLNVLLDITDFSDINSLISMIDVSNKFVRCSNSGSYGLQLLCL